ncbi:hypothetical protein FA95DRAFT_1344746 [Auriscalpium vulgare]|uniref:Uncharacterized protein n=1 Tax=Auriscalpium vulgare TaxID=40419 RepID=A0ACB8R1B1_9AGAM|nr:hypothetical protein FA95DRAFT_1344746 [Auriscalpium vulgare]
MSSGSDRSSLAVTAPSRHALIFLVKNPVEAVVQAMSLRATKSAWMQSQRSTALLDDPDIDAVYNPLSNETALLMDYEGAHRRARPAEKPSANTADDTRSMVDYAKKKDLVLLEASHYTCARCVPLQPVGVTGSTVPSSRNDPSTPPRLQCFLPHSPSSLYLVFASQETPGGGV